MKNYKQILEAVSRGIQLAIDDYQDIEPNDSISHYNDVIDSEDVIKQKIDLMKEVVDLGLPSRTLWAKYNLGVDSKNKRKLRYPKNWKGDYYAWGETRPNIEPKWSTYKFSSAGHSQLTKYCTNPNFGMIGFNDGLDQLQPEDDIVTITLGEHFHIPTKKQFEELIQHTVCYWTDKYKEIPNLAGKVFVSDINDKEIFFPKYDDYTLCVFSWSANISNNYPDNAWILNSGKISPISNITLRSRVELMPIRPVYNK